MKSYKLVLRVLLGVGVLAIGLLGLRTAELGQAAQPGTFTVNTSEDTNDGICNAVHCTLREAVDRANGTTGLDTIVFSLPANTTITLAGFRLPIISDDLIIDGRTSQNLTISADNASRIFEIASGTAVTLTTLTITEGICPSCSTGGGINNSGTLVIDSITFTNNADGGIYNNGGTLIISQSVFDSNEGGGVNNNGGTLLVSTSHFEGNVTGVGGAIANSGSLTVSSSSFKNNEAWVFGSPSGKGGAIFNTGSASISSSIFEGNWAAGSTVFSYGGDIYNNIDGTLSISNSSFIGLGNFYADIGGSIYNDGMLTLVNSTISNNVAMLFGGGIANYGTAVISNSSIIENLAPGSNGGGVYNEGVLDFSNTIIAYSPGGGDCINFGTIGLNVSNLVEDGSCSPAHSGDPLLGPLENNGSLTPIHTPMPGSPAIDSGDDFTCEEVDQRYVTRPVDGDGNGTAVCDIGAVEAGGVRVLMPVVLKLPD